jgi:ribonuclease E
MTQPRRKRRRRRGGRERSGTAGTSAASSQAQPSPEGTPAGSSGAPDEGRTKPAARKSRRRRGRGRGQPGREESEVRSSEDLVRAPARRRPATLTRPPDGTTLEQVIGELQSDWGVPQHPQEFRITLRVADDNRTGGAATVEELREERPPDPGAAEATPAATPQVRREKAPAAPRVEGAGTNEGSSRRARRRKRSRRRARGRSEN